jgi:hypothetical protein
MEMTRQWLAKHIMALKILGKQAETLRNRNGGF